MEPSKKSPEMTKFLENMFGRSTAIQGNTCTTCAGDATSFRDDLSVKEYAISGMCQTCQDEVFGANEN